MRTCAWVERELRGHASSVDRLLWQGKAYHITPTTTTIYHHHHHHHLPPPPPPPPPTTTTTATTTTTTTRRYLADGFGARHGASRVSFTVQQQQRSGDVRQPRP